MSCLICAGQAQSLECTQGWEERQCLQCGHYRMSQTLIRVMMEEGQIFDTGQMREWLAARRELEPIPGIDRSRAIWMV